MRHALLVAIALLALPLAGPRAAAQQIPSPYRYIERTQSASVFAGYVATDRGELGIGPHSAPLFGAAYTVRFSGPVSGTVEVGALPTERTVFQRVPVTADSSVLNEIATVDAFLISALAGLRLHLAGPRTWRGLAPYLEASGGAVFDVRGRTEVEEAIEASQRVDFGPALAVGIAAGTDWFLTERLALRLEAQDHLWRITTPEGLSATRRRESEWTNNLGVTLGAALYF